MKPAFIVDLLDEVGKVLGNILEGFERHRIDRLDPQRFHEALGFGVVVGVAPASHRADQAVGDQCVAVELGSILRAAIGGPYPAVVCVGPWPAQARLGRSSASAWRQRSHD